MIKAVFTDIDGTLKNSNREVSEYTRKTLKRCKDEGLQVILVSGRSRQNMLKFKENIDIGDYIISSNGADVYNTKTNEVLFSNPIDKEKIKKIYDYVKENNFNIKFNYDDKLAINRAHYSDEKDFIKTDNEILELINNNDIVQCVVMDENIKKMKEFKRFFYANFGDLKIENESKKLTDESLPDPEIYYCDVINKDVSKGQTVEKLVKKLYDSTNEVVTVGDGENDISMFKATRNSVAMGNASPYVKGFANYETKTNDEDGLAYMLNRILDNNK